MAASPLWKVYFGPEYRAACKYVQDAAALVSFLGDGSTIRCEHRLVLWTEGEETQPASESYDFVAIIVWQRLKDYRLRKAAERRP